MCIYARVYRLTHKRPREGHANANATQTQTQTHTKSAAAAAGFVSTFALQQLHTQSCSYSGAAAARRIVRSTLNKELGAQNPTLSVTLYYRAS